MGTINETHIEDPYVRTLPHLSKPSPGHNIYLYFLLGLDITKPNSVWCFDITYIPSLIKK